MTLVVEYLSFLKFTVVLYILFKGTSIFFHLMSVLLTYFIVQLIHDLLLD